MKFNFVPGITTISRHLTYRTREHSFDMIPPTKHGFTSVLIDDLNLEINDSGRVISIWGMCPETRWVPMALVIPAIVVDAAIFAVIDGDLSPGVSVRLNANKYLATYVDRTSGWIHIDGALTAAVAAKAFPGVIIEITATGEFSGLWLRPSFQP